MIPYTRVHALQLRISNKLIPTVATKRTHCAKEWIRARLALIITVTYRYVVWASFYFDSNGERTSSHISCLVSSIVGYNAFPRKVASRSLPSTGWFDCSVFVIGCCWFWPENPLLGLQFLCYDFLIWWASQNWRCRISWFAAAKKASFYSYSAPESDPDSGTESESSFFDRVTFLRDNCFFAVFDVVVAPAAVITRDPGVGVFVRTHHVTGRATRDPRYSRYGGVLNVHARQKTPRLQICGVTSTVFSLLQQVARILVQSIRQHALT